MKKVTIYTDGACSGNPGPGGWGAILMYEDVKKEISGAKENTTNNIMEITAVLEALKLLKVECEVKVYSDSAYVVNCYAQGWYIGWENNGWRNAAKKEVANQDLWQQILPYFKSKSWHFYKTKGHANDYYNNYVDTMAQAAAEKMKHATR